MKLFTLILFFILSVKCTFSQFKTDTYINKSVDGYIHLYFDEQYFLTEQNCEFKTYTRVCRYNRENGGYDGFFTDYYNNGKIALKGNYIEGKKHGDFDAFYPNGAPKYHISFVQDTAKGLGKYYYPSGEPWLEIEFINQTFLIRNFWNKYGVQKVANGKGKYTFTSPTLNFNELGYSAFIFKGRIRKGLPVGIWTTDLLYPNQETELIGFETLNKGRFQSSNYFYPENASSNLSFLQLYPVFYPLQSDNLIKKSCTIDDNQGYNLYLKDFLNANLPFIWSNKDAPEDFFKVKVSIDSLGKAKEIVAVDSVSTIFSKTLIMSLKEVNYWIPSFIKGKTVSDSLTITFYRQENDIASDTFAYPSIVRNKEN